MRIFSLLLVLLCTTVRGNNNARSLDVIDDLIYVNLPANDACITLLNATHTVGCQTTANFNSGRLLRVANIDALIDTKAPTENLVLIMPRELLTKNNVQRLLSSSLRIVAVLLEPLSTTSQTFLSPASKSPLSHRSPYTPPFEWNPMGDNLLGERIDFAVVQIPNDLWNKLKSMAAENEERLSQSLNARNHAQLQYEMKARNNAVDCLAKGSCQPLGGYSVWSSLGVPLNTSKSITMAVSSLDSNALIHSLSLGFDANLSGLVSLVAAVDAITQNMSLEMLQSLPRQILFAAFASEAFDLVGSRSFLNDIISFSCTRFSTQNSNVCLDPLRADLSFTNVSLTRIEQVLELSQIARATDTLYAHIHPDTNVTSLIDALTNAAQNVNTDADKIQINLASTNVTGGTPPGSSWSFVSANINRVVVLSDHEAEYQNPFYHSVADIDTPSSNTTTLCTLASITAQALLDSAGATDTQISSVKANCTLVDELIQCLAHDFNCELSRSFLPTSIIESSVNSQGWPSRYTGVYVPGLVFSDSVLGTARFIYEIFQRNGDDVAAATTSTLSSCNDEEDCQNTLSRCHKGRCIQRTTHYHDSVEPALVFNNADSTWNIVDDNFNAQLWCESNWATIVARAYAIESSLTTVLMVGIGATVVVLTLAFRRILPSYALSRFKLD